MSFSVYISAYNRPAWFDSAFAEVRLMLDGKKREKSLDEFLEETLNSKL